ncbi:MAG: D-alanyl-D-alanine carboxypeptidase family protein [Intestinibacter bartlettii]|uniref:D-alanyl-D-alanine carboxypeptidase family protein n=1 Tax=Intestinibacter bartlettii TaxID=261299 RepID=UPI0026EF558B|nr:D-alanyl-D-alanine carboxypeptidase family protein [Intestinibacter bartlettii]MDO5009990.1 D-alanyl-D-alanine carboxypeptidase family protein [Intestinibacter bartlettii]
MKKKLSYLLVCLITAMMVINSCLVAFADETYDKVDLISNYGVVIDYETGKVLGGKNIDSKVYPASTTKIWTAYLVVKNAKNLDEPIEITEPPGVDGSSMYLEVGEIFTVRELLQGLLIHSSNDAAVVLAKYVSGSVEEFSKLMNEEAKKAGALNTHFNNPHGLPDENHYTTPYDMAMLARKAMSEKLIREIVNTKSLTLKEQDSANSKVHFSRYFTNTNLFLTSNDEMTYRGQTVPIKYDIVDGIKTGYTDDAGRCLLSSAVKNDMRVIAAVFKSHGTNVYVDSRTLLDYGFENYTSKTIIDKEDYTKTKRVLLTKEKELIYQPKSGYKLIMKNGESSSADYSYKEKFDYNLPIYEGDKVGTLEIYNGKKLEKTIDLVSTNEMHSTFAFFTESNFFKVLFKIILFLILAFIVFIVYVIIRKKYRKKIKRLSQKNKKKNTQAKRKSTQNTQKRNAPKKKK